MFFFDGVKLGDFKGDEVVSKGANSRPDTYCHLPALLSGRVALFEVTSISNV